MMKNLSRRGVKGVLTLWAIVGIFGVAFYFGIAGYLVAAVGGFVASAIVYILCDTAREG